MRLPRGYFLLCYESETSVQFYLPGIQANLWWVLFCRIGDMGS